MGKILIFLYGIASYVIFFVTFLYLIAFVGNFDMLPYVTKTIDSGQPGPLGTSIMISVGLVSTFLINHFELFGLQQIYNNLKGVEMPMV